MENKAFFCSDNEHQNHGKSVGIVIRNDLLKSVVDFVSYSDRTALLKLTAKPNDGR